MSRSTGSSIAQRTSPSTSTPPSRAGAGSPVGLQGQLEGRQLGGLRAPTRNPSTCPINGWARAATLAKTNGTMNPSRWCASGARAADRRRTRPTTTKPTTMNAPTHMCANCSHTKSLNIAAHGSTSVTCRRGWEPGGIVHPGVDRDHAERADDAGDIAIGISMARWRRRRHPAPAVEVDAEEDRLDEERQPLERERQPKHVAEPAHQTGPQQTHLEAEDGSGHRADREQHGRHSWPTVSPAAARQGRPGRSRAGGSRRSWSGTPPRNRPGLCASPARPPSVRAPAAVREVPLPPAPALNR